MNFVSSLLQMSELPETIIVNNAPQNMSSEMESMMDNFNRKTSLTPSKNSVATNGLPARQNLLNSSSSNSISSVSKSSQQVSKFLCAFLHGLEYL